jgi:cation:H+ antiporter
VSAVTIVWFGAGLVLLVAGAELLVRSASRLAAAFGISPLIIGLTIVAFGTGSPELAVGIRSAFDGQADIAVGNVIGSNIFNILFVLGLSAAVAPLVVAQQLVRLDVPIMIAASLLMYLFAIDLAVDRFEGGVLTIGIIAYTLVLLRLSRRRIRERMADRAPRPRRPAEWLVAATGIAAGLTLLVLGARLLVDGAVSIAYALGVSELVVALTVVAAGTSLPEAATSVVAGLRGQRDIAVGNVVGSNIYNILMVLGLAALFSPAPLDVAPAALNFDIPVMVAVAIACLPIFFVGGSVRRWEGLLFLGYWLAYTLYVVLNASGHDALPAFSRIMSVFVIPLTIVTVAVVALRTLNARAAALDAPPPDAGAGPPAGG